MTKHPGLHAVGTELPRCIAHGLALILLTCMASACRDATPPNDAEGVARPEAQQPFDAPVEPGVGRVLEADADHPAAQAVTAFYADYLAQGATSEGQTIAARLQGFDYASRADVAPDMAQGVDALLGEAGEDGLVADPFLCSASLPSKVSPILVSEEGDRVRVRMQARYPDSAIPQLFTAEATRTGGAWQLATVSCR